MGQDELIISYKVYNMKEGVHTENGAKIFHEHLSDDSEAVKVLAQAEGGVFLWKGRKYRCLDRLRIIGIDKHEPVGAGPNQANDWVIIDA